MNALVCFELAKLLKEKGFSEPSDFYYERALTSKKDPETGNYAGAFGWKKGETTLSKGYFKNGYDSSDYSSKNWYMCSAPSVARVIMWLFEKHDIWIYVDSHEFGKWCYNYKFNRSLESNSKITEGGQFSLEDYTSPIEAYEASIEHVLKNLI